MIGAKKLLAVFELNNLKVTKIKSPNNSILRFMLCVGFLIMLVPIHSLLGIFGLVLFSLMILFISLKL